MELYDLKQLNYYATEDFCLGDDAHASSMALVSLIAAYINIVCLS